ncbi:MAG: glycine cleavage T C-terminal barrel domain-containing protein [Archangium sp.]|nr:glycine cleavage T C-terminal barrel domain-containing protein [Archangium sp.]
MPLPDEVRAIRTTTALCDASHVVTLRVGGAAAFATLDRICPAALALQDTQLRPTVLLREDGTVFADAYVARDDERYFLICEGPGAAELEAWGRTHAAPGELQVERLDQTHQVLSLHGPWAWDLLAACLGADVLGMPYLSFLRGEAGTVCFRAGKTGEFGYELLVPNAEVQTLRSALLEHGREWDLARVSLEALDHCALENWFFNIRKEGTARLSPLELGLQWRLAPRKDFVGAAALKARRVEGRLTCVVADGPIAAADAVLLDGRQIGRVLSAGESHTLGKWIGAALLELQLAVPGIPGLVVRGHAARTTSPPVINNRSLYVSPQRHTWADRNSTEFPPLALGVPG